MSVQKLYVASNATRPAVERIRCLSIPFEVLFAGLAMLSIVLLLVLNWIVFLGGEQTGLHILVGPHSGELVVGDLAAYPPAFVDVTSLPMSRRVASVMVAAGVVGAAAAAFFCLSKLFGAYRQGAVFAEASVRWMRWAGFFLFIAGIAPLASHPLLQAIGLPDERLLPRQSLAFVIVGAALFVLSNVMALGREIEIESEGYV